MLSKTCKKICKIFTKIFQFFFCFFAPSLFEIFLKNHHIMYSRGTSINFELSNVKNRQRLGKIIEILKFKDFFQKLNFRALRGIVFVVNHKKLA